LKKQLIVLIGGPGTGKTTLINTLIEKGYRCYPEVSREVIQNAQKEGIDQLFLEKPLLFSELLLQGRIKQHQDARNETQELVFLDRGIPDVVAYLDFVNNEYPEEFTKACEQFKYDRLFLLPPWEEIYQSDNERYESFEQATQLYQFLAKTYANFGYQITEVPKDTVNNRVDFILNSIENN
jgi:predicted ATPase